MTVRRAVTVLGAALALTSAMALPVADAAPPPIIGGQTVTDAPWAASVYQSGTFACSGSIVAPTWVLTARHCTRSSSLSVRVGSVHRSQATTISVTEVSVPPRGDLALLRLSRPLQTTYAQLPETDPPTGSTNQICGWGRTGYPSGPTSDQLKCADGPELHNGQQVGVASTADGKTRQTYASVPAGRAWIRSIAGV
ncbi:S1 family peptidase [Actinomadura sp. 1N219]|uniref:S1 family peptidase n=1 Tax=Actinomadura sp. 1N219 TaxID=3375152 RepID=UPI0037910AB8